MIKTCLPSRVICPQSLRFGGFVPFPYYNAKFSNSFFPYFTSKYNKLGTKIKVLDIPDFKKHISTELKYHKYKHYSHGSKYGNTLLTRLRVGRSYLNSHSFSIGMSDTNICSCTGNVVESPLHFITQCPNLTEARRILYDQVEQLFIPHFKKLSLRKQFDILVHGYDAQNPELKHINTKLMILTQTFILKSKRFD